MQRHVVQTWHRVPIRVRSDAVRIIGSTRVYPLRFRELAIGDATRSADGLRGRPFSLQACRKIRMEAEYHIDAALGIGGRAEDRAYPA